MSRISSHIAAAAKTAERIVTEPAFRKADANGFDDETHYTIDQVVAHQTARSNAEAIMFETALELPRSANKHEVAWEEQRRASLGAIVGARALTQSFDMYFLEQPALSEPNIHNPGDLDGGQKDAVQLNTRIVGLRNDQPSPLIFMEAALETIEQTAAREHRQKTLQAGPENYATALKFFADKVSEQEEVSDIERAAFRTLTSQALDGFFEVAKTDTPNYIEMTNVYASFVRLPRGTVDARFTKPLVEQSLMALPEYSTKTVRVMMRALAKLDIDHSNDDGDAVARLVNLGIRKGGPFERTDDLRDALRTMSLLPRSHAADRAILATISLRQGVEKAARIDDADEIVARIRTIADDVVSSQKLYAALKEHIALPAAQSARTRFRNDTLAGKYTAAQEHDYRAMMQRIALNVRAI